ncbi:MAG: winged helix-turn-helix domain-containing protein [Psychrosphaera sp.]|nr:winged helix-turn-helix domain-containing protein [Psychrosphaera sp.]
MIKIGHYVVKPAHNQLERDGKIIDLEPLAMAMLLLLAEEPGRVIGADELFEKLWQGKVVTDSALHRVVRQLRKAFDDKAASPQYIRTVKKSGYVLISPVEKPVASTVSSTDKQSSALKALAGVTITVLMVACFYWLTPAPTSYRLQDSTLLTSLPGVELAPTLWPQQNSVIFTHQPQGELYNNIVVRPLDSSEYRYLTDDYLHYADLSLSHDGRYLTFVLRGVHDCTIKMVDLTTANFTPVALTPCRFEASYQLAWSSDSSSLYYRKKSESRSEQHGNDQIMAIDVNTKQVNKLSASDVSHNDYLPTTEPGGTRVAYVRLTSGDVQIRLFNTVTKADVLLKELQSNQQLRGLTWLRGKQALLLNTQADLQVLTLDGQLTKVKNSDTEAQSMLSVDQTGQLVYASTTYTTQLGEYVLPHRQTPPIKEHFDGIPIALSSKSEFDGQYDSNNQTLVFLSNRESKDYRLWLQQNGQTRLLHDQPIGGSPRWSGDNTKVMFFTRDHQIAIIDIISGKVTQPGNPKTNLSKLAWGHNNTLIYFSQRINGQHQLFKMDLPNEQVTQLSENGGYYLQATNHGRYLYYNKLDKPGLWRLDLNTQAVEPVLPNFHKMNFANWQAFDNGVYYIRDAEAVRGLFFYDFATRQQRQLIDNKEFFRFSVTADQSKVLITEKKSLIGDLHLTRLMD